MLLSIQKCITGSSIGLNQWILEELFGVIILKVLLLQTPQINVSGRK